jgi:hypothetical protein
VSDSNYELTVPPSASSGVSTFNTRSGAVVPASGDYTDAQVTNTTAIPSSGATVRTVLIALYGLITALVASLIGNDSSVVGTTVKDALNTLLAAVNAKPSLSTATPLMDGTGAPGAGTAASKNDHVHPNDTSRAKAETLTATKTANYSANFGEFIPCDTTGGGFTVTLPDATTATGDNRRVRLKRIAGTNTVTLATTSAQTISGLAATTFNIIAAHTTESNMVDVVSDGANWIVSQYGPIARSNPAALGPAATTGASRQAPALDHGHKLSQAIRAQTGTTDTLVLADQNAIVTESNAAAITQTVPPNSSVALEIGSTTTFFVIGAGQVTFAQGAGVTINPPIGYPATNKSRIGGTGVATVTLTKIATDTWVAAGDLSPN